VVGYGKRLNSDKPVVNVGKHDNPNFMPAEVLVITAGQFARLQLEPAQTQKMIGFAVQNPRDSRECVARGRELIGHDPGSQQVSLYANSSMPNHSCAIGY
jgi:hypothetical protein